jgi:hypothetical protein
MLLSTSLVQFIESGVSTSLGSANRAGQPEVVRVLGTRVNADASVVCAFLPRALSERSLDNLKQNPRVALTASRVIDHRTLQLKGSVLAVRDADTDDQRHMQQYLSAFSEQLFLIGMPRSLSRRVHWWPALAIEFAVTDLFEQTPGPGAGSRIDVEEAARVLR